MLGLGCSGNEGLVSVEGEAASIKCVWLLDLENRLLKLNFFFIDGEGAKPAENDGNNNINNRIKKYK